MKRPPPALIALWYAKLRAGGFRDVEGGRDLNKLHAWTFSGASRGVGGVERLPDNFEPPMTLADHPTAVYYRGIEHAQLTATPRVRVMVRAVLRHEVRKLGARIGMTEQGILKGVRKLAKDSGLVREAHGS